MTKALLHSYQHVLPKHLLTKIVGKLANVHTPWLKNFLIDSFIKIYGIDMTIAVIENPHDYPTFNSFFTRQLKSQLRPIATEPGAILSPVDGTVTQFGTIQKNQLLQAKKHYYDLETLLGNTTIANDFFEGTFATFYLAPYDYHRVHMPLSGELAKAIYVPGKLYSVNPASRESIPYLYTRNERLITLFNTETGPLALIFVASMIVGGIKTTWMDKPFRSYKNEEVSIPKNFRLQAGDELGYFCMGSTVILLFPDSKSHWLPTLKANHAVKYGEVIGKVSR